MRRSKKDLVCKKHCNTFTEKDLLGLLSEAKATLAVAESCTGGALGAKVTDAAGSSRVFLGGVIAYHNTVKNNVLRIPKAILAKKGAVSKDVALCMASGIRHLLKSDIGVALTGIAGPDGGTAKKPVGLVYIAVSSSQFKKVSRYLFKGTRKQIKKQATQTALNLVGSHISQHYLKRRNESA